VRVKITVTKNLLPQVAANLPLVAYEIVEQVALGIRQKAAAGAPIGPTGDLARGYDHMSKRTSTGAYGEVWNNVEYAPYVEFGTGQRGSASTFPGKPEGLAYTAGWIGMAARPHFTPAVEEGRVEFKSEWRNLRRRLRA
jgi:hypothetical protein